MSSVKKEVVFTPIQVDYLARTFRDTRPEVRDFGYDAWSKTMHTVAHDITKNKSLRKTFRAIAMGDL